MSHPAALPHGTRLHGGAYAIGPVLGQGGFGITYKGGDLAAKRYVAIKEFFPPGAVRQGATVFPGNINDDYERAKTEFLNEAQTLARFQNPGIVGVLGSFEENNSAYMVMKFLEGQTLSARLASKGVLDEWEVLDLGLRLCRALEIVHAAAVLHRDIKPDNIILTRDGRAVLIDFGSARALESGGHTQIVTPGYAPLEQYASNAARGPGSDLYALGATLYHALGGQKPVDATDRATDIALPPLQTLNGAVSPVVAGAIMNALEMEMAHRPPTAREFAALLQGHKPATAATPTPEMGASLWHQALERHTSVVNAVAFAPDGETLVSAGADRKICAWKWKSNVIGTFWNAGAGAVNSVAFAPDGALLASGGRDERVSIWDGDLAPQSNRAPVAMLQDCRGVVRDLSWCPTRRELLVADAGAVTLWDAATGVIKARREMGGVAIAWSPDGALVAMGGVLDGALHLWNGGDLSERGAVAAHQGALTGVAWSPDGSLLASIGNDGWTRVWSVADGTLKWERQPAGVPEALAWSPDGKLLAVTKGNTVFLWSAAGDLWRRYNETKDRLQAIAFAPRAQAPYDYVIAVAARDRTVNLCRIRGDGAL